MEPNGARSNPQVQVELTRLAGLHGRLLAKAAGNPTHLRSAPPKLSPVLETVTRVLEQADRPLRACEIHAAAERLACGPLLWSSVKGTLAAYFTFKLSRFGRGALETLQAVDRIRSAGGRLVTVEDGVDSAKPGGRLLLTVLAGLAEEELEQQRSGWANARRQALERGVHVGPTPVGYRRRSSDDRKTCALRCGSSTRRCART